MEIADKTLKIINEHMDNIATLRAALDNSEKTFDNQLQDEFLFFSKIISYVRKKESLSENDISLLEEKSSKYKNTNKYRYGVVKSILDYNKYIINIYKDIPF